MRRLPLRLVAIAITAALSLDAAASWAVEAVPVPGDPSKVMAALSSYAAVDDTQATNAVERTECAAASAFPKASKTEAAAIAAGQKALRTVDNAGALKSLETALRGKSAQLQEDVLYSLGLGGRFGGAAATTLLLAQKVKDRRHLVNASALFMHLSLNSNAYDLLVWADKRKPGSNEDAAARAAYFAAWGAMNAEYGKFAEAEAQFRKAIAAYNLAPGPRVGLASALQCQGKTAEAARWWARGQRVIDLPQPFEETPADPTSDAFVSPAAAANVLGPLGTGKVMSGWKLILVEPLVDPSQGIGGSKFRPWDPPVNGNLPVSAPVQAMADWEAALMAGSSPESPRLSRVQRAIANYAGTLMATDRSVRIIEEQINVQARIIVRASLDEEGTGCAAADNFGEYWGAARRLYELHQDLADRYHQIWTAAAKQTASKAVNTYFNQVADYYVYDTYVDWLHLIGGPAQLNGWNITTHAAFAASAVRANDADRLAGRELSYPACRASFLSASAAQVKKPDDPKPGPDAGLCNSTTKGLHVKQGFAPKIAKNLPVSAEFKMVCDAVSVSLAFKSPPVGVPFAMLNAVGSGKYDSGTGKVEIFSGVTGNYGIEAAGMETSIGVYVVYGPNEGNWEMVDAGIKVDSTAKVAGDNGGLEVAHATGVSFITGNSWYE